MRSEGTKLINTPFSVLTGIFQRLIKLNWEQNGGARKMELLKRVLVWVLTLIFALCLSPTTSAQTNTSVLNGELPGGMGSPSPQRFNTVLASHFLCGWLGILKIEGPFMFR